MSKKNTQKESVSTPAKVYNFCSKKKLILGVVIAVLLVFIGAAIIRGIHLAIEFKGGTLAEYAYNGSVNENDIASLATEYLGTPVKTQLGETFTGEKQTTFTLSFSMDKPFSAEMQDKINEDRTLNKALINQGNISWDKKATRHQIYIKSKQTNSVEPNFIERLKMGK